MTQNNLRDYALTPAQWKLAEHLVPVLEIFNELTNIFSKANVPLIYEVIPMLEHLEHALDQIYNAKDEHPVIQIAAQAALQVVGKYYALTDDNEVCRIAIIMCPEKGSNGSKKTWTGARVTTWKPSGLFSNAGMSLTQHFLHHFLQPRHVMFHKWAIYSDNEDEDVTSVHPDSMDAYLNTPCISRAKILAAGGLLRYWENARATHPRLAQMALDFLSAPGGSLQVNHLQHGVSSQTFKAQMAVGSWYNTPLMNDLGAVTSIMRMKMVKGKGKASGKGKSNNIVIDSD
ncbi:hypothetical protein DFJ58DRAFT_847498 [Suillus subalutaceus]|uniref:uncharacterized protein n=1 Tax=Suillus subalutaceus TaxID=48586 RepID=UPI001B87A48F|nr:uncharacterized protein DFJ58DRAFT_847498 [Suillus subalutaceus]KAG1834968.1 hypothetical protein DFJ58DRAFT_847498 [Suillus subalutaceus]